MLLVLAVQTHVEADALVNVTVVATPDAPAVQMDVIHNALDVLAALALVMEAVLTDAQVHAEDVLDVVQAVVQVV